MSTTRERVFKALEDERFYQLKRWGERQSDGTFAEKPHSIGEFILYMEDYLEAARKAASRLPDEDDTALHELRKVVTLGIACFEQHDCPIRDFSKPIFNGRDGTIA